MPSDFTIIISTRQHFGNQKQDSFDAFFESGLESGATFVGREQEYQFSCPNVEPVHRAVLSFQSLGVSRFHRLEVNGSRVPGGLQPGGDKMVHTSVGRQFGDDFAHWKSHTLIIDGSVLKNSGNTIHIESKATSEGTDDFIVDNMVVLFKTK